MHAAPCVKSWTAGFVLIAPWTDDMGIRSLSGRTSFVGRANGVTECWYIRAESDPENIKFNNKNVF